VSTPNILSNTTMNGDYQSQAVGTSATAIVTNAAASGKLYKVIHLNVANIHATNPGNLTVDVYDGSTARRIITLLPIAINSAITVLDVNRPVILLEGYTLRLTCSASSVLEATAHVEIWS
jgi:hypothetical protein